MYPKRNVEACGRRRDHGMRWLGDWILVLDCGHGAVRRIGSSAYGLESPAPRWVRCKRCGPEPQAAQ